MKTLATVGVEWYMPEVPQRTPGRRVVQQSETSFPPDSSPRNAPPEVWPPNLLVLDEVRRLLKQVSDDSCELSERTTRAVLTFVNQISGAETTYPSVAADSDGVAVLHWVAGPWVVQVDVDDSGPIYLWSKDDKGSRIMEEKPARITALAQNRLARLSSYASQVNPSWRTKYLLP